MSHDPERTPEARPSAEPSRPRFGRIGLGCVTFGREIDRASAFALMDYAFGEGIRLFDTAAAYGSGASETIVGEWLRAHPSEQCHVAIATKVLPPYSAERIAASVDESLRRLRVDTVDLLFLHQWHESAVAPETLATVDGLVRSGKIRAVGSSNFDAGQLRDVLSAQAARDFTPISALQNIHNLAMRGFDQPLSAICKRGNIARIGYSPVGAGFLTGKHRIGVVPGSRFDLVPGHQRVYFHETANRRLARLEAIAQRTGLAMPLLALAWALHSQDGITVLVGGRTTEHLQQAFDALRFANPTLLEELSAD